MTEERSETIRIPYVGLTPYSEENARLFFGREIDREVIIDNLGASRLTVVYGESGVGKSSLLNAGVVSHMRQLAKRNLAEFESPEFAVAVSGTWSGDPIATLKEAVRTAVQAALEGKPTEEPDVSLDLGDWLKEWADQVGGDLYVILDQFEEYFRYHPFEDGEGTFAVEFPRAVNRSDLRVNFLIAIREDSLAKLDRFKPRIPTLLNALLRIRHLDREAGRAAIVGPIERYNEQHGPEQAVTIEPELIEAVLDDIRVSDEGVERPSQAIDANAEDRTGVSAPLLQLVMTRLWEAEEQEGSRSLRLTTLRQRVGGADQIVERHVEESLGRFEKRDKRLAIEVLDRLVTPSGTKIAQAVPDLAEWAERSEEEIVPVLEALADAQHRILHPVAGGGYEIFHDVLAQPIQGLLAREREQARGRKQTMKWVRLGGSVALIAVVGLAVLAAVQWRNADARRRIEEERGRLTEANLRASQSLEELDVSPEGSLRAVLLAFESLDLAETPAGYQALREALSLFPRSVGTLQFETSVLGMVFTQAGARYVTTGSDGALHVWDGELRELRRIDVPAAIEHVALSSDGLLVATSMAPASGEAEQDNPTTLIHVWNVATGERMSTLEPEELVTALVFSVKGLLAIGQQKAVTIWDAVSGERLASLPHDSSVYSMAFSPDGETLAAAGSGGDIRVWQLTTGEEICRIEHQSWVTHIAMDPQGLFLATASLDGRANVWDIAKREKTVELLPTPPVPVSAMTFSPGGERLVAARWDGVVRVWDWKRATPNELSVTLNVQPVNTISFSPSGEQLVMCGIYGVVRTLATPVSAEESGRVAVSPEGSLIATATGKGEIQITSTHGGLQARVLGGALLLDPDTLAFSPDAELIAAAVAQEPTDQDEPPQEHEVAEWALHVWDIASADRFASYAMGASREFRHIAFSANGEHLAVAARTERTIEDEAGQLSENQEWAVEVWDVATCTRRSSMPVDSPIEAITFSPDGAWLATASWGGSACIWDWAAEKKLRSIEHKNVVSDVAFSPDGELLVTASQDNMVRMWDPLSGSESGAPMPHETGVRMVAFDATGKRLATATWNIVRVWDVSTGKLLDEIGQDNVVDSLAFAPDGRSLLSVSGGTVHTWLLYVEDLVAEACYRLSDVWLEEDRERLPPESRELVDDLRCACSGSFGMEKPR